MKNLKILSWTCVCVILLISSISTQHQHGNRGSGRNSLCEMSGYVYNAKTNTIIQCSKNGKYGGFCKIHNNPPKNEICKKCSKKAGSIIKHTFQWEHFGKID